MNRRELLRGSAALAGPAAHAAQGLAGCEPCVAVHPREAPSPLRKLRVKPVMTNMVHTDVWEGPCRFNVVPVAKEAENVKNAYARWAGEVKAGKFTVGAAAELLEPHLALFDEAFVLPPAQMLALDQEKDHIDAFLVNPSGASFAAAEIARRYRKPVVVVGLNCRTVDVAAYAKSIGEEVLAVADNAELERTFTLLRARAAYRETRVLFPTDRGFPSVASLTGITDLAHLERRYGVQVKMISYRTLAQAMERTLADPARREQAETEAAALERAAAGSHIDRQWVARSLQFRQAVESLMAESACNAFTIECFEFCASRLPEKWRITPCLVHTLFKDQGLASSCEGDMGALLATRLLLSVSGKSSHMGNMFRGAQGAVIINHSAPGLRMNGFDQPPLAYKLGRFVQSGWGTKAVVDFTRNAEQRATVARVHPNADKVLVMRGAVAGAQGWDGDRLGCSVEVSIRPALSGEGDRFIRRQREYGNHLSWVYGDYAEPLAELAQLLGMEAEVVE